MKTPLSSRTFESQMISSSIWFTLTIGPYPDTVCNRALALVRATDRRITKTNLIFMSFCRWHLLRIFVGFSLEKGHSKWLLLPTGTSTIQGNLDVWQIFRNSPLFPDYYFQTRISFYNGPFFVCVPIQSELRVEKESRNSKD